MPHLVLAGKVEIARCVDQLSTTVHRWGRAVLKTEDRWQRADGGGMLVEGVVVEFSRPLHPVALVVHHHDDTIVRLWSRVTVERTGPVQRWLCLVASEVQLLGAGPVKTTNIPDDIWSDLDLEVQFTS